VTSRPGAKKNGKTGVFFLKDCFHPIGPLLEWWEAYSAHVPGRDRACVLRRHGEWISRL
jgi:hypothetical protein